jgi:hypothetical protein
LLVSGSKYAGRTVNIRTVINRAVAGGAVICPERYYLFYLYYYYYRRRKTAGERMGEGVTNKYFKKQRYDKFLLISGLESFS